MKTTLSLFRLTKIRDAIRQISALQAAPVRLHPNAAFSYALRRNLDKIGSVLNPLEKERREIILRHTSAGLDLSQETLADGSPNPARATALAELHQLLEKEVEIEFHAVSESNLELDKNNIPLELLETIQPMISVESVVKTVLPKAEREGSIFFADTNGNLLREDPNQRTLPLRTVPAETATQAVVAQAEEAPLRKAVAS